MRAKIKPSLAQLRRHLQDGHVARLHSGHIQIYERPAERGADTRLRLAAAAWMNIAATAWKNLTPQQQRAWRAYRDEFAHRLISIDGRPAPAPHLLYVACATRRLLLGNPPVADAPHYAPPDAPLALTLEPCTNPTTFQVRVKHRYGSGSNLRLLVKITAPTGGRARKPFLSKARAICGNTPDTAQPLAAPGEVITFTSARYAITPGQRFGLSAQLLHPDTGLASQPLWCDLVR